MTKKEVNMKKWILLLLMIGFYSLASAHEEKDGMNPAGTYQLVMNNKNRKFLVDTRTGQLFIHRGGGWTPIFKNERLDVNNFERGKDGQWIPIIG